MSEARAAVEEALGGKLEDHFAEFGPPVAAASIAQVHKAVVIDDGVRRNVAVKILRPGIEKRFRRDLDSYFFAARQIERFHPPTRRLRPVAVVDTLGALGRDRDGPAAGGRRHLRDGRQHRQAIRLPDGGFRVPDGRLAAHRQARADAGMDRRHPDRRSRRAARRRPRPEGAWASRCCARSCATPCATAFSTPTCTRATCWSTRRATSSPSISASWAGSAPRSAASWPRSCTASSRATTSAPPPSTSRPATCRRTSPWSVFAQAMRAIGEPIHGRTAEEISMADLLGQLFAYTEVFDMQTRPELLLLQKTMVVVEGVARSLDPGAQHLERGRAHRQGVDRGQLRRGRPPARGRRRRRDCRQGPGRGAAPAGAGGAHGAGAGRHGARRASGSTTRPIERLAAAQAHHDRWSRRALWAAAAALLAIAAWLLTPLG